MNSNIAIRTFIYISVILPSGSIFGINVKMLLLFVALCSLLQPKNKVVLFDLIKYSVPVLLVMSFIVLVTMIISNNDEYVMTQAKDIVVFFIFPCLIMSICKDKSNISTIINTTINALVTAGFIKAIVIAYSFVSGMPVSEAVSLISSFFNVSIMSLDVDSSYLGRINFPSDAVLPIAIFMVMNKMMNGTSAKSDYLKIGILFFSVLIGMSRFYWAATMVAMGFSLLLNIKSRKTILLAVLCFISLFYASTTEPVQNMVAARFDSRNVDYSDGIRTTQLNHMMTRIDQSPMLGEGLGYYMPEYIRGYDAKYSYELQIPALVMQIGFTGVTLLLLLIITPVISVVNGMAITKAFFILSMFSIWIASGFFNPVLFSSSGGVLYTMILLVGKHLKKQNRHSYN
ncbi:O-antigen ligase family protein [Raoultella ornithinolytica]|uniref:O-antigen ligase family protein n=1 Tax=Raoultella ornithinolytica TaxID=54291 RepID=UPI0010E40237|nr:O-antigen ligase family protein [Raoultella ornithinolytica]VTN41525.1 Lipid A core - O-antigen ligase and related enzymes [Raoultella ornithinolytica]